jgi:hypothetical protein
MKGVAATWMIKISIKKQKQYPGMFTQRKEFLISVKYLMIYKTHRRVVEKRVSESLLCEEWQRTDVVFWGKLVDSMHTRCKCIFSNRAFKANC